MQHDVRKLCFDILQAIADIKNFTEGLDFDQYRKNRMVKPAVESEYEIIGEALKRMQTLFEPDFLTIADGRKIIDFRNLLAHGYDDVADEIVWGITSSDVIVLQSEDEAIVRNHQ